MTSSEPRPTGRWRQEVLALLLLFVALFVLLSLCSYLLPLVQAEPGLQRPEANWCGALGYYTAHYLLSFLGLMAFLPVGILLYAMVSALVRRPEDHRLPFLVAGLSGIAISSAGCSAPWTNCCCLPPMSCPAGTWGYSSTAC